MFIQSAMRVQRRQSVGDLLIDHSNAIPFAQLNFVYTQTRGKSPDRDTD
jgi:hypothetical protein